MKEETTAKHIAAAEDNNRADRDAYASDVLFAEDKPDETMPPKTDSGRTTRVWWRSGWLWLTVTIVVVVSFIALAWILWITENNHWGTVRDAIFGSARSS